MILRTYSGVHDNNGLLLDTYIEQVGLLALVVEPHHVNGPGRRKGAWRWTVKRHTEFQGFHDTATVSHGTQHRTDERRAREFCLSAGRDALADAVSLGLDGQADNA